MLRCEIKLLNKLKRERSNGKEKQNYVIFAVPFNGAVALVNVFNDLSVRPRSHILSILTSSTEAESFRDMVSLFKC